MTLAALAPSQPFEDADEVKFLIDDLTHTGNLAASGATTRAECFTMLAVRDSNHHLPRQPISPSLRVDKDGEHLLRSREEGFDYFSDTNGLAFYGSARPGEEQNASDHVGVHLRSFVP